MRRLLPIAAAAMFAACSREYPNPFGDRLRTSPIPAEAEIVFVGNGYAASPGAGRELYAVSDDGASLTRLTYCNENGRTCDVQSAALADDRQRVAMVRVDRDSNADGRLGAGDDARLLYLDLLLQAEAELLPASQRVQSVDWSPTDDILVYSAQGEGGEDLFRTTPVRPTADNAQGPRNLTCPGQTGVPAGCDATLRERSPRVDPSGTVAVFERIAAGGAAEVWVFQSSSAMVRVTAAPTGGAALLGTPYTVGADATPDYSPDGRQIVFRRLTAAAGRGSWDILAVGVDGTGLRTLAAGAEYRGEPDWGPAGILYPELDPATGVMRLVVVQPDGSGRRAIVSLPTGYDLASPRWLR